MHFFDVAQGKISDLQNRFQSIMPDRYYTEEEVQKLIKRAAALEAGRKAAGRPEGERGLSIEELKNIASETGLNPDLIEQAAAELDDAAPEVPIRVNREELVSEVWLDRRPDSDTIEALITELNHIYGTTDELNWWDNLWGSHEGKAKVKRSPGTTEWNYKTEAGIYATRVLMQQRNERFRIRVSKRQLYGVEWESRFSALLFTMPLMVLLGVLGGVGSSFMLGPVWPGILAGILLAMAGYPVINAFLRQSIEKNKAEVARTAGQLSELVQYSGNSKEQNTSTIYAPQPSSFYSKAAEVDAQPGKLRNSLRE